MKLAYDSYIFFLFMSITFVKESIKGGLEEEGLNYVRL